MSRWANGTYVLKNPAKYIGKGSPRYRSGWEHAFFRFCDNNDAVLEWASESIAIPYRNPVTGKQSVYIPDILMTYRTRSNQVRAELIEIKPKKETIMPETNPSRRTKAWAYKVKTWVINQAKWQAAKEFCADRNYEFRIMTEEELGV